MLTLKPTGLGQADDWSVLDSERHEIGRVRQRLALVARQGKPLASMPIEADTERQASGVVLTAVIDHGGFAGRDLQSLRCLFDLSGSRRNVHLASLQQALQSSERPPRRHLRLFCQICRPWPQGWSLPCRRREVGQART